MAKFFVLSLLRTRFNGDIVVFKNTPAPLFPVARAGVREVLIDAGEPGDVRFWDYAQAWKFRVRHLLDVSSYDRVLFLDADCLALRNLGPLLEGDWDLRVYAEPGSKAGMKAFNCFIPKNDPRARSREGINGGAIAVRAALYHETMEAWERIHDGASVRPKFFADQAALTRLVIDSPLRTVPFTRAEMATPLGYDLRADDYLRSSLVHLAGAGDFDLKLRFMFGLYVNTFFFDRQATLLNILDF